MSKPTAGTVDLRVNEVLVGRFEHLGGTRDPHLASVERMSHAVLQTLDGVVQQQVSLWQSTLDAAHQQWAQLMDGVGEHLPAALAGALDRALQQRYAADIAKAGSRSGGPRPHALGAAADGPLGQRPDDEAQQQEMSRQSEVLLQVVQATGDVVTLERSLNDNLKALAGAKNFEETVMSLSAAIHLLTARRGNAAQETCLRGAEADPVARPRSMRRPRSARTASGIQLFPFLAVLICAMGALIVLLVLVVQQARVNADTIRAEAPGGPERSGRQAAAAGAGGVDWQRQVLEQQREELARKLARAAVGPEPPGRPYPPPGEKPGGTGDRERRSWNGPAKDGTRTNRARQQNWPACGRRSPRAGTTGSGQQQAATHPRSFTIIPYAGPNGTRRRPIYIECRESGIILQPEGIVLKPGTTAGRSAPEIPWTPPCGPSANTGRGSKATRPRRAVSAADRPS